MAEENMSLLVLLGCLIVLVKSLVFNNLIFAKYTCLSLKFVYLLVTRFLVITQGKSRPKKHFTQKSLLTSKLNIEIRKKIGMEVFGEV